MIGLRALVAFLFAAQAAVAQQQGAPPAPLPTQGPAIPPRVGVGGEPLKVTLEDVIRRALENNADVALARIDTQSAAETVRAAQGVYDPKLIPSIAFQKTDLASASALGGAVNGRVEQQQVFGGLQLAGLSPWAGGRFSVDFSSTRTSTSNQFAKLNPQYPSSLGVTFVQPLLRNRSIDVERRTILLAQRAADLTHAELTQTLMDQLMLVEQSYWELAYAVQFLDVQTTALAQAEGQVASNERQVREGTLAPIDVVEAATQVAGFRQLVASAQQAITEAENRLKLLMLTSRTAPEWNQPLIPISPSEREAPVLAVDETVKLALSRRPELAANDATRAQTEVDRRFFGDQAKPQIDLVGTASLAGLAGGAVAATDASIPSFLIGAFDTSLGNLFASRYPAAVVQLQMELPLRNTEARANVARADLSRTRVERQRTQLEQSIEVDVRNALQAVASTRDRLAGAASASRNAQEQYASERRRFDSGLGTVFLVLERQTALVAAQAREVRARTDFNQALALLDRATGGTLERYGITVR